MTEPASSAFVPAPGGAAPGGPAQFGATLDVMAQAAAHVGMVNEEIVEWHGSVVARRRRRFGALVLEDKPINKPDPEKVKAAMLAGLRLRGLPWTDELLAWRLEHPGVNKS